MSRARELPPPPIYSAVVDKDGKITTEWVKWFSILYEKLKEV